MEQIKLDPMDLIVTLSDLTSHKSFKYFTLLVGFKEVFAWLDVHVIVYSLEDEAPAWYANVFDCERSEKKIEALKALKTKVVFGEPRQIAYSYLFLYQGERRLLWMKRINYENLVKVCKTVIQARSEEISKKFEKLVDIPKSLW